MAQPPVLELETAADRLVQVANPTDLFALLTTLVPDEVDTIGVLGGFAALRARRELECFECRALLVLGTATHSIAVNAARARAFYRFWTRGLAIVCQACYDAAPAAP